MASEFLTCGRSLSAHRQEPRTRSAAPHRSPPQQPARAGSARGSPTAGSPTCNSERQRLRGERLQTRASCGRKVSPEPGPNNSRGLDLRDWGYPRPQSRPPSGAIPLRSLSQGLPAKVPGSGPGSAGAHRKGPEDVPTESLSQGTTDRPFLQNELNPSKTFP